MDADTILALLDAESKARAFDQCFATLEGAPQLDLDALRMCIKLWLPIQTQQLRTYGTDDGLANLLMLRIPREPLDLDQLYQLAEILCSNGHFANMLFREKMQAALVGLLPKLSKRIKEDATDVASQNFRTATALLNLLRCSFWLPSNYNHVVDPGLLTILSSFLDISDLDDVVLDTISSFFSLLKRGEPMFVAPSINDIQPWVKSDEATGRVLLAAPIIGETFWDQLRILPHTWFTTGRSLIFLASAL